MASAWLDVVGQLVALLAQLGHDQLAVQQVHLAADRLDVELLLRRGWIGVIGHHRHFVFVFSAASGQAEERPDPSTFTRFPGFYPKTTVVMETGLDAVRGFDPRFGSPMSREATGSHHPSYSSGSLSPCPAWGHRTGRPRAG